MRFARAHTHRLYCALERARECERGSAGDTAAAAADAMIYGRGRGDVMREAGDE